MNTYRVIHDYGMGLCVTYVDAHDEIDCAARCAPFTKILSIA